MAILLDGNKVAQKIKQDVRKEILQIKKEFSRTPLLACVCFGKAGSSDVYVKAQAKVAAQVGLEYRLISLKEDISYPELAEEIRKLNHDPEVDAIMMQTPLPAHIDLLQAVKCIVPHKDAEGLHPQNLGKIILDEAGIVPCTAQACLELIRYYDVKLFGKEVVVVGHSPIVGKPLSLMLLNVLATVTVCHIGTSEAGRLAEHVRRAEVLIVAVGQPAIIKGEWIKQGAVVIDVGINCVGDKIVGDVEFAKSKERASYITPVPGGVGPLTVAMLMSNSAKLSRASMEARLK
ncbi:MAG: bifunctional 5,10-methylenetetrahydrofolate dehydrogenase/5,10-methenyltetrahydrofolate cyclohydrolase [Candidatus Omnitrophota bacterium]